MLDNLVVEHPGNEQEAAARTVIVEAGLALSARRSDIPKTFVAQLYARVVPDDIVHYGAEDFAVLAERAYDYVKQRQPGA